MYNGSRLTVNWGIVIMKKIIYTVSFMLVILIAQSIIFISSPLDLFIGLFTLFFYIINFLASVACGIYSGFDIKRMWYIPIIFSVIFLLSYSIIIDADLFGLYIIFAGLYLVTGYVAMFATYLIRIIVNKNKKVFK